MGLEFRSAIFCFLHLIILGPPHHPILCHIHPICANTLHNCLLPSPHPEPTPVTLRPELFLQFPQPFHIFSIKMRLVSRCKSIFAKPRHMTAPREVTCEVHCIAMLAFVICPTVAQLFCPPYHVCASSVSVGLLGT